MFQQWSGSALTGGMKTMTLNRIVIDGARATPSERWDVGHRIRDVEGSPDGALDVKNANPGGMFAEPEVKSYERSIKTSSFDVNQVCPTPSQAKVSRLQLPNRAENKLEN